MTSTANGLNSVLTRLLEIAIDLGRYQESVSENPGSPELASLEVADLDVARAGLAGVARRLLKEIDARENYFPGYANPDPVWPVLLDLYVHAAECRKVSITSACVAARVPTTTALRWIGELVERGAVDRSPDPNDGRRFYLSLTPKVFANMSRYLAGIAGIDALIGSPRTRDFLSALPVR